MLRVNLLNKRSRKQFFFYSAMIALPLLQVVIFYFVVNVNSILLAFKNYKEVVDPVTGNHSFVYEWTGFEHFTKVVKDFFIDPTWKFAFRNSLIVWLTTSSVSMMLALFFSYYIFKKGLLKNFFRVTLFLPSIISSIVMVVLFKYLVDSFIPAIVLRMGGDPILGLLSDHKTTMLMLIIYGILMGFGSNVLLLSSAMSAIPTSLTEAAQIDGANRWKEFWHVVFPQIFPTFLTIFVISIANLFANQMNLFSFYGKHAEAQFSTIGYILYKRTLDATYAQYSDLAAIGIVLTIIIVPITLGLRKILEKAGPSNE